MIPPLIQHRRRPRLISAAPSPLLTNLSSYWKLDEASGNAIDAHGVDDATITGTIGTTTGRINGARNFDNPSNQQFGVSNRASINFADIHWCAGGFFRLHSTSGQQTLWSRYRVSGNLRSMELFFNLDGTSGLLQFNMSSNGQSGTLSTRTAATFGTLSSDTTYWCYIEHDPTANLIGISINNGTLDTASHSSGAFQNNLPLTFGRRENATFGLNGWMDEWFFYRNRRLDSSERAEIYNSGAGLAYPFS